MFLPFENNGRACQCCYIELLDGLFRFSYDDNAMDLLPIERLIHSSSVHSSFVVKGYNSLPAAKLLVDD